MFILPASVQQKQMCPYCAGAVLKAKLVGESLRSTKGIQAPAPQWEQGTGL